MIILRIWSTLGLTHRLIFYIFLAAVVPILALSLFTFRAGSQGIRTHVENHLTSVVIVKSQEVERWFRPLQARVHVLAASPDVKSRIVSVLESQTSEEGRATSRLTGFLNKWAVQQIGVQGISVLSANRDAVLASAGEGIDYGLSYISYGSNAESSLQLYLEPYTGKGDSAQMLIVAPVMENDTPIAHINLIVSPLPLYDTLALNPGLGSDARVYLVNQEGIIVSPLQRTPVGSDVIRSPILAGEANDTPKRGKVYTDFLGTEIVGAYHPLESMNWGIVAELPTSVAFSDIDRMRWSIIAASGCLFLLILVVTLLATRRITRPLSVLMAGVNSIASGDFDHRIRVTNKDEIGLLANAFNDMAAKRKDAEEKLQIANNSLETRIEERTGELKAANDQLKSEISERRQLQEQLTQAQKMESIGKLAGGVAHDFNNLLTPIVAYAEIAISKLPSGDPLRVHIEEIHKAGERAANLVSQLLAFSRKQIIEPKIVDVNEIIASLEKMLRRLIGEDIELVTILDPNIGQIKADPGQVDQLLINLAVNARDAMPAGGRLTIETGNFATDSDYAYEHLDIAAGRYVMLAVCDNGSGMTDDVKARIFEPFFTTKGVGEGTGLGLSTCYGIVKQNGGSIYVYSEPGEGTAFKIYLPKVESEGDIIEDEDGSGDTLGGTETILLVEDEAAVRQMAAYVLKEEGYTVLEASNGVEALQIVDQGDAGNIDLLLTDVVMPQMGGKELVDNFTALYPNTKVIYTSGYTDDAIVQRGVLDPGTNFIQKPLTPKALAGKVRELLDGPSS